WKGRCAQSVEKREPASDIDRRRRGQPEALDPNRPIREADISRFERHLRLSESAGRRSYSAPMSARRQRSAEHGGSDENAVFGDRRMSGLIAFKQRASGRKQV